MESLRTKYAQLKDRTEDMEKPPKGAKEMLSAALALLNKGDVLRAKVALSELEEVLDTAARRLNRFTLDLPESAPTISEREVIRRIYIDEQTDLARMLHKLMQQR